jgi:hypothetical protein
MATADDLWGESAPKVDDLWESAPSFDLPTAQKSESAKMSGLQRTLASLGGGMLRAGKQVGNLVGLVPDESVKETSQALSNLTEGNTWTGTVPSFVGEALPQVATAMAAPGPVGAGLATRMLAGGLQAVGQKMAFSDPGQRLEGLGPSAAVGALFPAAGAAIKRAGEGLRTSGAGRYLSDLGYGDKLTIGQRAPDSIIAKMENAASRAPLLGQFVQRRQAEGRSVLQDELGRWMEPDAFNPRSALPQSAGTRPWFDEAAKRLGTAYEDFANLPKGASTISDTPLGIRPQTFLVDLQDAVKSVPGITPKEFSAAASRINNILSPAVTKRGGPTWGDMHEVRSNIRAALRKMGPDTESQYVKEALRNMEGKVTGYLGKPLTSAESTTLSELDKAYSASKLTEGALVRQSGLSNTPSMSAQALRKELESSLPQSMQARGTGGPQRDFVEAADKAFAPVASDPSVMVAHSSQSNMPVLRFIKEAALATPVALGTYSKTGQRLLKGDTAFNDLLTKIYRGAPEGTEEALRAATVEALRSKERAQ